MPHLTPLAPCQTINDPASSFFFFLSCFSVIEQTGIIYQSMLASRFKSRRSDAPLISRRPLTIPTSPSSPSLLYVSLIEARGVEVKPRDGQVGRGCGRGGPQNGPCRGEPDAGPRARGKWLLLDSEGVDCLVHGCSWSWELSVRLGLGFRVVLFNPPIYPSLNAMPLHVLQEMRLLHDDNPPPH